MPDLGNLGLEYQADLGHLAKVLSPLVWWVPGPSALGEGYGKVRVAGPGYLVHLRGRCQICELQEQGIQ